MSITVKIDDIEVVCSTPEEAAMVAKVAPKIDAPSKDKINQHIKGPFKVNIYGVEVMCDTAEAAAYTAVAASAAPNKRRRAEDGELSRRQGSGPARAWEQAEEYAKKHNITTFEARSILAKRKKELMAKAYLNAETEAKKNKPKQK
jgi:uncharacterized Zn-finger protein